MCPEHNALTAASPKMREESASTSPPAPLLLPLVEGSRRTWNSSSVGGVITPPRKPTATEAPLTNGSHSVASKLTTSSTPLEPQGVKVVMPRCTRATHFADFLRSCSLTAWQQILRDDFEIVSFADLVRSCYAQRHSSRERDIDALDCQIATSVGFDSTCASDHTLQWSLVRKRIGTSSEVLLDSPSSALPTCFVEAYAKSVIARLAATPADNHGNNTTADEPTRKSDCVTDEFHQKKEQLSNGDTHSQREVDEATKVTGNNGKATFEDAAQQEALLASKRLLTALVAEQTATLAAMSDELTKFLLASDLYHLVEGLISNGITTYSAFRIFLRRQGNESIELLGGGLKDIEILASLQSGPSFDKDRRTVAIAAGTSSCHFVDFPRWIWNTVIDTKPVQRLRQLKQLGVSHLVFPEATHTRFAHSLGVAHLGAEMANELSRRMDVTDAEREFVRDCVTIAGVCHDLGHGPFSHIFERKFARCTPGHENWTHESMSSRLLDKVVEDAIEKNISNEDFYDVPTVEYIRNIMMGQDPEESKESMDDLTSLKRAAKDIIANRRHGMDVDRMEYIGRDGHVLGESYQHATRLVRRCQAFNGEIAFHYREQCTARMVYDLRKSLFERFYLHPKTQMLELMMVKAMRLADPVMRYSAALEPENLNLYMELTDTYVESSPFVLKKVLVEPSRTPEEVEAATAALSIIKRLQHRDFYRFCIEVEIQDRKRVKEYDSMPSDVLEEEIVRHWPSSDRGLSGQSLSQLISTNVQNIKCGDFNKVRFYSPHCGLLPQEPVSTKSDVSVLRLYSTVNDGRVMEAAKVAFKSWADSHGFRILPFEDTERRIDASPCHKFSPLSRFNSYQYGLSPKSSVAASSPLDRPIGRFPLSNAPSYY